MRSCVYCHENINFPTNFLWNVTYELNKLHFPLVLHRIKNKFYITVRLSNQSHLPVLFHSPVMQDTCSCFISHSWSTHQPRSISSVSIHPSVKYYVLTYYSWFSSVVFLEVDCCLVIFFLSFVMEEIYVPCVIPVQKNNHLFRLIPQWRVTSIALVWHF